MPRHRRGARRFRELVKAEISRTVSDPALAQEELRYLVEVLAQPARGLQPAGGGGAGRA